MSSPSYCPVCLSTFSDDPGRCTNLSCGRARPARGWSQLLSEGDLLDRHYRVDELVAVGGAGVTYRVHTVDAEGAAEGPSLAVKVLHTQRASGSFLQRLSSEAQILQGLRHPHIVECLGFVQRVGHPPYLVTRFEPGGTLEQLVVDEGPLSAWSVAGILRQLMSALAAAHRKGVVHRDLKPPNILLRKRAARIRIPHIRVADFGIAKVAGSFTDGLTRVGAFIGTPDYAAPEQFSGQACGPAADVFASGALAYWLLTGRTYFVPPESGQLADYPDAIQQALPAQLPEEVTSDERGRRLSALLDGMMRPEVADRWSVEQASEYLDWVLGVRPGRPDWLRNERDRSTDGPKVESATTPPHAARSSQRRVEATPPTTIDTERGRSTSAPRVGRKDHRRARVPARRRSTGTGSPSSTPEDDGWKTVGATAGSALNLEDIFGARGADNVTSVDGEAEEVPYERPIAGPVEVSTSGEPAWSPREPVPVANPLPAAGEDLLRLLASVAPRERKALCSALLRLPPEKLNSAIRGYAPGGEACWGRGVGLAVELLRRDDWEPIARSLLSDPEPGVRIAAAAGLARVGDVVTLKTLSNLLKDEEPLVRVAAVRALARCARATGRGRIARYALQPLLSDPEEQVADTVELALVDLE